MKIKVAILSFLIGLIVLSIGYERSLAISKSDRTGLRIGVVSVLKILKDCKRNAKFRQEATTEQNRAMAELDKLKAEFEAEEAGLKTLKSGSSDYMAQVKEILTKRANFQAQQEFYKRQIEMKEQRWAEDAYKDILRITSEVAKQKGLDLVLEMNEPELPAPSYNGFMTILSTHKVLYSDGCSDITDEVMARLDANN